MGNAVGINSIIVNRSVLGTTNNHPRQLNKSSISCLNNASDMVISDTSQDFSAAYASKDKNKATEESKKGGVGFLSSLFN